MWLLKTLTCSVNENACGLLPSNGSTVCTFSESDILIETLNWAHTLTSQITGKYKLVYFHVDALIFTYETTYRVKQAHREVVNRNLYCYIIAYALYYISF